MEWNQLGINEKMAAITNSLFYNTVKDNLVRVYTAFGWLNPNIYI